MENRKDWKSGYSTLYLHNINDKDHVNVYEIDKNSGELVSTLYNDSVILVTGTVASITYDRLDPGGKLSIIVLRNGRTFNKIISDAPQSNVYVKFDSTVDEITVKEQQENPACIENVMDVDSQDNDQNKQAIPSSFLFYNSFFHVAVIHGLENGDDFRVCETNKEGSEIRRVLYHNIIDVDLVNTTQASLLYPKCKKGNKLYFTCSRDNTIWNIICDDDKFLDIHIASFDFFDGDLCGNS